ncbi:carbohydrate ABC transporter permease [candidate division KSB1 bacterium]|nr:carbohydrate ABC transporter permease [candidate division KSB1 bacterium]
MKLPLKKVKQQAKTWLIHGAILLFLTYLVFPLLWMISISFKPTTEIYSANQTFVPQTVTREHFRTVVQEAKVIRSIFNSFYVGILASVVAVLIALPGAYALVRYQTAINKIILGWILTSQIFPVILIMVPLYILLRSLSLTNSLTGLVLVYVVWSLPFVLWMLHGYIRTIPLELEEAATIDGATRVQFIYRILAPVLLPAIGAATLFAFISAWNEFFFALVLLKSPDLMTIPVELARFTGMEGQARTGPLAAASFIATIPSIILFVVIQKWFSSGLVAGAVKN